MIEGDQENKEYKKYLVFFDETGLGQQLVEQLERSGQEVIGVEIGETYMPGERKYRIRPTSEQDYKQLFHELKTRKRFPDEILHLWSVTAGDENDGIDDGKKTAVESIDSIQNKGFFSLLFIARAIEACHVEEEITITAVVNHTCSVTGQEVLNPGKATILGPLKVIPQEYPGIYCRCIDIVQPPGATPAEGQMIDQLEKEVVSPPADKVVALRGTFRWVQVFEPLPLEESPASRQRLKEKGVYIITGGLGDISLVLARYLAQQCRARLVLTGRSPFPVKEEWQEWFKQHEENDHVSSKIKKLLEMEALGVEIVVMTADAADHQDMNRVVHSVLRQFGRINGVIHAAGMVGRSPIMQLTRQEVQQQFQAKIYGLCVLKQVLEGHTLDFCFLISSSSAVLGGLGFAAYAASNIFMDVFVQQYINNHSFPWIAYDLDVWNYSPEKNWSGRTGGSGASLAPLAMTLEEGLSAFHRVLNCREAPRVIQSTGDLQVRIDQWIGMEPSTRSIAIETDRKQPYFYRPRPNLLNPYIPPQNQMEQKIADIWQNFFDIEKVGVYDDFFQLGGDSLKAVTLVSRIRKQLNIDVPFIIMFRHQTIRAFARHLEQEKNGGSDSNNDIEMLETLNRAGEKMKKSVQRLRNRMR